MLGKQFECFEWLLRLYPSAADAADLQCRAQMDAGQQKLFEEFDADQSGSALHFLVR